MLLKDDPRPESPPPPPIWTGVVSGLGLLAAMVGLIFHNYRMAGVGIGICNIGFLFLAVGRMSPRTARRFWLFAFLLLNADALMFFSQEHRRVVLLADGGALMLFAFGLLATRIWPDRIWLRRDGPQSKGD
jgi:hypothetical protein